MSIERPTSEEVAGTRQFLADRKQAFGITFSDGHGKLVVEDLTEFARCGLDQADVFYQDARKEAYYAGRASILKRIRQYLELPLDDLLRLKSPQVYAAMMAGASTTEEDDD